MLQGGNTSPAMGLGNGVLQIPFNQAYTEAWQTMASVQVPRVHREFYYLLPAFTSYLDPASAGISDMGEPEYMFERGGLTSVQIATTSTDTPILVTTVAAHGLSTNADVTIGQVTNTQSPCGRWFVTVIDSLNFTLNGSVSDGNAGIGGAVTTSPEFFQQFPVRRTNEIQDRQMPSTRLSTFVWQEGIFQFRGATAPAQIRVDYFANPTPPTSALALLGIPEALLFLQTRSASIMARMRGLYSMADALKLDALGPSGQADGSGGQLRLFLLNHIQGMQLVSYRKQPFRPNAQYITGGDYPYGTR
jgi:hypothetical protein